MSNKSHRKEVQRMLPRIAILNTTNANNPILKVISDTLLYNASRVTIKYTREKK